MATTYDAIVVGARCAGSPTAMLLARKGYRVLVVDRATFPSDTISTHLIHPPGVDALAALGAARSPDRDRRAANRHVRARLRPVHHHRQPGRRAAYAPRRTVLDKLLVDAAAEAGAEIREGFTVEELVVEDDRVAGIRGHEKGARTVTERAHVVVGADGRYSRVADAVNAEEYDTKPKLLAAYYSYWSGLPMDGRFQNYGPAASWHGRVADERRPDARHRRLAVPRVRGEPGRRGESLLRDAGHRAGARGARSHRDSRGALRRRRRARLLPQAVRSGLGAGRRRGLQHRLHHRPGDHRRVPARRALRGCAATRPSPESARSTRRWRATGRRGTAR